MGVDGWRGRVGVWVRGVGGVTGFHKHRMEVGKSKLSWDLNGRLGVAGEERWER